MKEIRQDLKDLVAIVFFATITVFLTIAIAFAYKLPGKLDSMHKEIERLDKEIEMLIYESEEIKHEIDQLEFEQSLERTCELQVIECEFE